MPQTRVTAAITLILCFCTAQADELRGTVTRVIDGDTLEILSTDSRAVHRIRLAGIDAPEKNQPFGSEAKDFLEVITGSAQVTVVTYKSDRYGRAIGKVLIGDADVNLSLIVAGLAWHYKQYQNEQAPDERKLYAEQERQAQDDRRGLWSISTRIPPWQWRRM